MVPCSCVEKYYFKGNEKPGIQCDACELCGIYLYFRFIQTQASSSVSMVDNEGARNISAQ